MSKSPSDEKIKALAFFASPRGAYLTAQAFAYAIRYLDTLPRQRQEPSNRADMQFLLDALWPHFAVLFEKEDEHNAILRAMIERHHAAQQEEAS